MELTSNKVTLCTVLFMVISASIPAKAQTFAEWFSQKKTQKQYLLQQIAALQVFSGYLHQGYQIASGGLGSISGYIKNENGLHTIYYKRMNTADPLVKNNVMVREIMNRQKDIAVRLTELRSINSLTVAEQQYLKKAGMAVMSDCEQQLNSLQAAVGNNQLNMSDAERFQLITRINAAMADNYHFLSDFVSKARMVVNQRQQERRQVAAEKKFYGIN